MSFRLSKKVTLEPGDKIRVSAGPYFLSKSGKKIGMAEKGLGVFMSVDESGNAIYVRFGHATRYVYIGPEHFSETTGTTMRPHKITKVRK